MPTMTLEEAKRQAACYGLDMQKTEQLLLEIEKMFLKTIAEKYQIIFFWALTGFLCEEDVAKEFQWSSNTVKSSISRNLIDYLKKYFSTDQNLGIGSLRKFFFKLGYFIEINDEHSTNILGNRLIENLEVEQTSKDKTSSDECSI